VKKVETQETEIFRCDFCGQPLIPGKDGNEINENLHLHYKCEDRIPKWARGETWFFDAIQENGETVGVNVLAFLPEDPLMNSDFILFVNSREDGARLCKCDSIKAVIGVYDEQNHENTWIEGVWHKGLFRKAHFKTYVAIEGIEGLYD
jgi:hypothetical protein